VPTKFKNYEKTGLLNTIHDKFNKVLKIVLLRKYYKEPMAYETLNPGLNRSLN